MAVWLLPLSPFKRLQCGFPSHIYLSETVAEVYKFHFFKLTTGHTFSVQSCWVWFVPLPSIIILMCLGFYWPRAGMLSTAVNTPCDICSQILSLYNYMNKQTSCMLQKEFTKFIKFIEESIKFSLSCCKDTTTEAYRTFWNKCWLCSFLSEIRKKIRFSPHHVLGPAHGAAAQTLVPVQWCGGEGTVEGASLPLSPLILAGWTLKGPSGQWCREIYVAEMLRNVIFWKIHFVIQRMNQNQEKTQREWAWGSQMQPGEGYLCLVRAIV